VSYRQVVRVCEGEVFKVHLYFDLIVSSPTSRSLTFWSTVSRIFSRYLGLKWENICATKRAAFSGLPMYAFELPEGLLVPLGL